MNYLYINNEIKAMKSSLTENGMIIQNDVTCIRVNLETSFQGGLTFVMNTNEVYRARLNTTGQVQTDLLFKVPLTDSSVQIADIVVTDNFTIVRYDNFTVASYLRPKVAKDFSILTKNGFLSQPSNVDSPIFHF